MVASCINLRNGKAVKIPISPAILAAVNNAQGNALAGRQTLTPHQVLVNSIMSEYGKQPLTQHAALKIYPAVLEDCLHGKWVAKGLGQRTVMDLVGQALGLTRPLFQCGIAKTACLCGGQTDQEQADGTPPMAPPEAPADSQNESQASATATTTASQQIPTTSDSTSGQSPETASSPTCVPIDHGITASTTTSGVPTATLPQQQAQGSSEKPDLGTCAPASADLMDEHGNLRGQRLPGQAVDGEFVKAPAPDKSSEQVRQPHSSYHIGPDLFRSGTWDNTPANVTAALHSRIEAKRNKCTITRGAKTKLKRIVQILKDNVFTQERVNAWIDAHPDLMMLKSGKWDEARYLRAVESIVADRSFKVRCDGQIKKEVLPIPDPPKPPRLIVSMGDKGTAATSLIMAVFEDLYFSWFHEQSIKHRTKMAAMDETGKMRVGVEVETGEGDGSNWDGTITPELMAALENVILDHLATLLFSRTPYWDALKHATEADLKFRKKKTFQMSMPHSSEKGCPPQKATLESMRRSGDRGTSALNHLVNHVVWLLVTLPIEVIEDYLLHPNKKTYTYFQKGVKYEIVWLNRFEGDDSIVVTNVFLLGLADKSVCLERWLQLGFNMKLKFCNKGLVTFCGCVFRVDHHGILKEWVPQTLRNFAGSAFTVSEAAKDDLHGIGGCAMLGRVMTYAVSYAPLASYYASIARYHMKQDKKQDKIEDRDLAVRLYDEVTRDTICTTYDERVGVLSLVMRNANAHYDAHRSIIAEETGCSESELKVFEQWSSALDELNPYDDSVIYLVKKVLPQSWFNKTQ
jgi:hypothetical protein